MKSETQTREDTEAAMLNWMHQIAAVVQELAVKNRMPFHADQIAAATKELHDAIMEMSVSNE